jgi:hypothetical protein
VGAGTCPAILEAGASCQLDLQVQPTAVGPLAATLVVSGSPGGDAATSLKGVGTTWLHVVRTGRGAGAVTSSPASLTCGPVCTARVGDGRLGDGPIVLTAIATPPSTFAGWAGGGCTGLGPCAVALAAATTVEARFELPPARVTIAPGTLELGSVVVGERSSPGTLTVVNEGHEPSGALGVTVRDGAELERVEDGCTGATLAPGATCRLTVALRPRTAGSKEVRVTVSASPGGAAEAVVHGLAREPAQLALTPATAHVDETRVGEEARPIRFTLTNRGQARSGLLSQGLTVSAGFALIASTCGTTLGAGGTCTVDVAFQPAVAGPASSALVIAASPGGSAKGVVTGTGRALLGVTGSGGGTVVSTPAGLACGGACPAGASCDWGGLAPFTVATVTLVATPEVGQVFQGWTGEGCTGVGTCTVTLDRATGSIGATFAPRPE